MAEQHEVTFKVSAQDAASEVMQRVARSLGGVQASYVAMARLFAGGTAIAAGVLAIQKIASATIEAERASNRLNAALRATAYAAGITRPELDQMAESLAGASPFDDDEIRKGLAALLRFRDVQGDIFRQAARLAPDLATALDTDVVGAYQRLGRALEDPEKGLRALREAGLNVTSTQERVNRVMKETGDIAAAQKIILEDLAKSIGGSASGEYVGLYGSLKDLGKAGEDFVKGGGLALVKVFKEQFSEEIERGTRNLQKIAGALRSVTPAGPAESSTERADAMRGARERESERLIEGYQKLADALADPILKEWAEREKRLREEDTKGWIAHIEAKSRADEEELLALEKIHDAYWAREEKLREESDKGWVAHIEELERMWEDELTALARIQDDETKKLQKSAQDLGFTFASAFENAIVEGEKLRDVLKGLAQDILRIFVRTTVTEPAANWLSALFSGLFAGAGAGGGGAMEPMQHGGPVSAGMPYLVGERGPELWVPRESGTVVPHGGFGRGSTFIVDMRGALVEVGAMRRLEQIVNQVNGSIERRAVSAVFDAQMRGSRV